MTTARKLGALGVLLMVVQVGAGSARAEEPTAGPSTGPLAAPTDSMTVESTEIATPTPLAAGSAFDRTFSSTSPAAEAEVGVAGKVVNRFAPPVAAPVGIVKNGVPVALSRSQVIRPCDTGGSGCGSLRPSSTGVGVPPIVPGARPHSPNP